MKGSSEMNTCNLMKKLNDDKYTVKKLEMRGIPRWEFERYLKGRAQKIIDDTYYGEGWQVSLSQERQDKIGRFFLVAVDVTLAAKEEKFEDFLFTFRKNFLRGGG